MIRKIKIFELIEISKIIDKLSELEITVSDAFEIYKFKEHMNEMYSFLSDITPNVSSKEFDIFSQEEIYFNIPMISVRDIINKYQLELTKKQDDIIHRFLLS